MFGFNFDPARGSLTAQRFDAEYSFDTAHDLACTFIARLPGRVTKIDMGDYDASHPALMNLVSHVGGALQSLELNLFGASDLEADLVLKNICIWCPRLDSIEIDSLPQSKHVYSVFSKLVPRLREIKGSNWNLKFPKNTQVLYESIGASIYLKAVVLANLRTTEETMQGLAKSLSSVKTLRKINVDAFLGKHIGEFTAHYRRPS
ncbi:MAG: hypothetical protein MRY21_07755 [Simkaniaceae bacterium]|nr:hypothetical protein [Simkaniaceae bacterium]